MLLDGNKDPQACWESGVWTIDFWQATKKSPDEWLEIDLGATSKLFEVEVTFREDCKQETGYMDGIEVCFLMAMQILKFTLKHCYRSELGLSRLTRGKIRKILCVQQLTDFHRTGA